MLECINKMDSDLACRISIFVLICRLNSETCLSNSLIWKETLRIFCPISEDFQYLPNLKLFSIISNNKNNKVLLTLILFLFSRPSTNRWRYCRMQPCNFENKDKKSQTFCKYFNLRCFFLSKIANNVAFKCLFTVNF